MVVWNILIILVIMICVLCFDYILHAKCVASPLIPRILHFIYSIFFLIPKLIPHNLI